MGMDAYDQIPYRMTRKAHRMTKTTPYMPHSDCFMTAFSREFSSHAINRHSNHVTIVLHRFAISNPPYHHFLTSVVRAVH